jgi:adenylate cyclase
MSHVFISYARPTAQQAQAVAEALRGLGYSVWIDDALPSHRTYSEVIEEQLRSAKAVVVIWSAEAAKSDWVRAEADAAREARTLVQLTVDGVMPPMPFNQIQCADLKGWTGDLEGAGWRKVVASIADLMEGGAPPAPPAPDTPLPLPTKPSVAVMPFANLSGDPEQEYFADGMVEEIVSALSRFKSIFVIGSGTTFSFKGKSATPQEVARQLGVRYVLEGSVRKAAERVRIAVKLTDASDGAQIWADRFEDTLGDVFALQDRVALSVAGVIEPAVLTAEMRRATRRPTDNMGSYDLYLRAAPLYFTYAKSNMFAALDLLNRSIALDPQFGAALAAAAACHTMIERYGWSEDPKATRRLGIELAHRALSVAEDNADVVASAAFTLDQLERDHIAAVALLDRAVALNPGSSLAWGLSGAARLGPQGSDVAAEQIQTAMRLDPMGPNRMMHAFFLGIARFWQGRFDETVALISEYARQTGSPAAEVYLAASHGHLRQAVAAQAALRRFRGRSAISIESFLKRLPEDWGLVREGVALAESVGPTGGPSGA